MGIERHWVQESGGESNEPMLLSRHVYSSWYLRQVAAMALAFSSPKWEERALAMEEVERRVP